jgi:hypothetical protein
LISKANDEEKNVEKLGSEDKFNRKTIIFTARIDEIINMKSIGSTFPLSKIVQPVIMLDGFPVFTSISFKSFKLILSFVNGPMICACFSFSLT